MTEYPYGRQGILNCYNEDKVRLDELVNSGNDLDNECYVDGDTVYLYEAPIEQDSGRGYYSVWEHETEDVFTQVNAMSGDDGMIYERFENRS